MALKLGYNDISAIYFGETPINKIYEGEAEVYSGDTPTPVHDYSKDYLTFKILSSGTINWAYSGDSSIVTTIQYSLDDGNTWTSITSSTAGTSFNVSAGDTVIFRGNNTNYGSNTSVYSTFSGSTATFDVEGNIASLISGDTFSGVTAYPTGATFNSLFRSTHVVNAEHLVLPALSIGAYDYQSLFFDCADLITAPELPVTGVTGQMALNATFRNCTSLTTAPELHITSIPSDVAYTFPNMFNGCTSLTTPPSSIGDSSTTMSTGTCTGMFNGCTSLTTAPELPSTTLATSAYTGMFAGCTSLTDAPELPATTLADFCYRNMFSGCSSLSAITCLATTNRTTINTANWVDGVAQTGTFTRYSRDTTWGTSTSGVPANWTVVDYYNFEFSDSSTTKSESATSASTYYTYTSIISTKGGSGQSFSVTSAPSWATASVNGDSVTITVAQNDSYERDGSIVLTQADSNLTLTVSINQGGLPMPYDQQYLTFRVLTGGTIVWKTSSGMVLKTIAYSMDNGSTWTNITSSTGGASINVSAGDKVLFKGTNAQYATNTSRYNTFSASTAYFNVEGNIMSLIASDNFATATTLSTAYTFVNLFRGTHVVSAEHLVLPATTLSQCCYYYMFAHCTSLTTAPVLPATTLAQQSYASMFLNCTSLTTAPELPATTLAQSCCNQMFAGCASLTTAPELSATTLANNCYYGMFQGCTSLTTAPVLSASTLVTNCYINMFSGCSNLNAITCLSTDPSSSDYTTNWLNGVAASGTFTKAASMTMWTIDSPNGIPTGWTVQDY